MKNRVTVKYQFYEVCCMAGKYETENLYDLSAWGDRVESLSLVDKIKDANGIKGRLESRLIGVKGEYEAFNFMRLDVLSNTYKVKEDTAAEHIDLELDEYIGKNTVILYDPRFHIAMVQCNRGSYGVAGIVSYINKFNPSNAACYFRPIANNFNENMLKNRLTKLDVRFANTREFRAYSSRNLERIVESCNEFEGLTAHIEIGLGYARGRTLNSETISEVVSDVRANKGCISSAKLVMNDDTRSSIFDLFDNIEHENISYVVPPRSELGFEYMANEMAYRYDEEARARVVNSLRNQE